MFYSAMSSPQGILGFFCHRFHQLAYLSFHLLSLKLSPILMSLASDAELITSQMRKDSGKCLP
jgi:hypothetical protein